MSDPTTVHVCRHGQVDNPEGILYGRLPGFHLSPLGRQMANRLAEHFAEIEIAHFRVSPLERAQETLEPIRSLHANVETVVEDRLIEAENHFAGTKVGLNRETLLKPRNWWAFRNPTKPSWGEPYPHIAARMRKAIRDAATAAGPGRTAVVVAHQLPIWIARLDAEGRSFVHDPRHRECTLASVTSFTLIDGHVAKVSYAEPAADLLPKEKAQKRYGKFQAGA